MNSLIDDLNWTGGHKKDSCTLVHQYVAADSRSIVFFVSHLSSFNLLYSYLFLLQRC
jgi:hypothetical protein